MIAAWWKGWTAAPSTRRSLTPSPVGSGCRIQTVFHAVVVSSSLGRRGVCRRSLTCRHHVVAMRTPRRDARWRCCWTCTTTGHRGRVGLPPRAPSTWRRRARCIGPSTGHLASWTGAFHRLDVLVWRTAVGIPLPRHGVWMQAGRVAAARPTSAGAATFHAGTCGSPYSAAHFCGLCGSLRPDRDNIALAEKTA